MSERGQRIFKWIVWIVILLLFAYKVVTFGMRLSKNEEKSAPSTTITADILEPTELVQIPKGELGALSADVDALVAEESIETQFVVMANPSNESIELYCNDESVGKMYDDGTHGDTVKGDGFYSLTYSVTSSEGDILSYYAQLGKKKSNTVELKTYAAPTEEDVANLQNTSDVIEELEAEYEENGYIPEDKYDEFTNAAYEEVKKYAEENNIGISEIEKMDDGLYVLFDSGLQYVYTIKKEGSEEGDDEVYLSVRALEPYRNSGDTPLASFEGSAELIDDTLNGAVFDMNYSDADVTFDNIKAAFQPNSFIIWHGHGGYNEKTGSFLVTGVDDSFLSELAHTTDVVTGRVICAGGRLAITYKYFNKHIKDLSNSFVYLGGCHTGEDKYLMSVMCWKNADVVVGFSDTVKSSYDCNCMKTMTEELCTIDPETEEYKTVGVALNICGQMYGYDDGDDTPARLMYMGDSDYRIDNLIPAKYNPPTIDTPDLDKVGKDVQDKVDKTIDDAVDKAVNSFMDRLQKSIDDWFEKNCGSC